MAGYVYKGNEPERPRKAHAPRSGRPRTEAVFDPYACGTRAVFDPYACGTRAGYVQHRRYDQEPCQPCRVANAAYSRNYKRKGGSG